MSLLNPASWVHALKKFICAKLGHNEKWDGEYLKKGKGDLNCSCTRCGEKIVSLYAEKLR